MGNAGQKKIDYTDPLSQYKSGKSAKIITQRELDEKKAKLESSHQLEFCKWLKHLPENYMYFSDISSGTKKSGYMQNIASILKSDHKFPDVFIFHPANGYVGCMIEMKRIDSGAILKDGSLSKSNHIQEQNKCHDRLRQMGWYVTFAEGFEEAKIKFEEYLQL
jgi:hypothetical protein